MVINPFRAWLEHDSRERAKDREMLLEAIREVASISSKASEVAAEQTRMLTMYLQQFMNFSGTPASRTLRDEDEVRLERERWALYQAD